MGGSKEGKGAGAAKGGKGKASDKGAKGKTYEKGGKGKGEPAEKGGKSDGYSKGKGKAKDGASWGKGKSQGKDASASAGPREGPGLAGAKTVQELEAEIIVANKGGRLPLEARGAHCEAKKHSEMGCAVVTMESPAARDIVLSSLPAKQVSGEEGQKGERREMTIGDHTVHIRPHVDKARREEVKTDLFIAWGHKSEKLSPLPVSTIVEAFDKLIQQAASMSQVPMSPNTAASMQPQQMYGNAPMMQHMAGMQQAANYYNYYNLVVQQQQQQAAAVATAAAMAQQQQANLAALAQQQQMQMQMQQQQMQQQAQHQEASQQASPEPQGAGGASSTPPQTPPRELRADATPFQCGQEAAAAGGADAYGNYNGCGDYSEYYQYAGASNMPERKPLNIVDPKSGQPIEVPPPTLKEEPKTPQKPAAKGKSKLAIINPSTKEVVDPIKFSFEGAAKDKRAFAIINPNDGSAVGRA